MEKLVQITRIPKAEFYDKLTELEKRNPGVAPQIPLRQLSIYESNRLITEPSVPTPDCITCGACCVYARIISMTRAESEPIKEYWDITLDGAEDAVINRVFPIDPEGGQCMNLVGMMGREVGCQIYSDRPTVCREFEPGSDRCHGYRRIAGIEPPLTDMQLVNAVHKILLRDEPDHIRSIDIELESKSFGYDTLAAEGEQRVERKMAKIQALIQDGTIVDLHTYDTSTEEWFEHELEMLTLADARDLINKRKAE